MRPAVLVVTALVLGCVPLASVRAEESPFDEVVLQEGKGPNPSVLYVVLTEPGKDFEKKQELVVRHAKAALKEAADRKFRGAIGAGEKPRYEGNVGFLIRAAKGDRVGSCTGFSVEQLKEIADAKPDRAKELVGRHTWTRGKLPAKE